PGEGGQRPTAQVAAEGAEADDPVTAPGRLGDVVVVDEGIVLLGIAARRGAREAGRGQFLHVCLPGGALGFELVDDVDRTRVTFGAIAGHTLSRSAREGEVVRERGMG